MPDSVTRLTLPNGLLVLLKEIHTAPLISHWVWYRAGSRNEIPGITGISHWVEHMQFKGTPRYPSGVLDREIARDGGYWNAMTSHDWTTYYETMPADKIDLALKLEADRMAGSLFDASEVESERTVIISERQGSENEPLFRLFEVVRAASFRVHSYHHDVIGDMADLETIQRDDLYSHYRRYYTPSNAVLAVAGDFDTASMLARIQEMYGGLSCEPAPVFRARPEPEAHGEQRVIVEGPGETVYLVVNHRVPPAGHPDFYPLFVLDSLLSGPSNLNMFSGGISNKTSRLYRALVEKELAVAVGGDMPASVDPNLHTFTAIVHPKQTYESVLSAIEAQIEALQNTPPSLDELRRAVKQARAIFAYGSESITNQAFWLGFAEMLGGYDWFLTYLDRLAAVTPEDVQRVAQTYFRPQNRVVGVYLPSEPPALSEEAEYLDDAFLDVYDDELGIEDHYGDFFDDEPHAKERSR